MFTLFCFSLSMSYSVDVGLYMCSFTLFLLVELDASFPFCSYMIIIPRNRLFSRLEVTGVSELFSFAFIGIRFF